MKKKKPIFVYDSSKVQAYLSAGKPIIASLNGEGLELYQRLRYRLSRRKCYTTCSGYSELHYHQSKSAKNGRKGRAYFFRVFEMNQQAKRLD